MDNNIIFFSVVRDHALYKSCVYDNPNCRNNEKIFIDNSLTNKAIPIRYNEFLDGFDYSRKAWIVFCHEDFEFSEPLEPLLKNLPVNSLYGPIGCARKGLFPFRRQVFLGQIMEKNRDGSGTPWYVGHKTRTKRPVETFDCCCLIVHSSLIQKFKLRFDEALAFDLYVEDFCATAKIKHNIYSRILPFKAVHHSGSRPSERLYRHLPYLKNKYLHNCFCATCTYFGTPSLAMRIEQSLAKLIR